MATLGASAFCATPDFDRDILPILHARCFSCHGGAEQRKGGLLLISLEDARLGGDSGGPAVVPGDSAASQLIQKVTNSDPLKRMPAKGEPLSASEIDLLRQWIDSGAAWGNVETVRAAMPPRTHWAFKAPMRPDILPLGKSPSPIDAFVAAKLEEHKLSPSPEADRRTLIRRTTLDLTGLPPTPAEVEAFVKDTRPGAYVRVVDRLLESPRFGERQARIWLDAARYADTNGYEKDRPRSIWPYRDWVIKAFNDNMPFDRFVVEQIAGDLLPDAGESQRIATGFHRNTMLNEEGGIDLAEDRFKATVDRVATTGKVFLGLTLECAQCHSHKFDPISQREYYRFFAFLNDTYDTTLELRDPAIVDERRAASESIAQLKEWTVAAAAHSPSAQAEYAAWLADTSARAVDWRVVIPSRVNSAKGQTLSPLFDGSILAEGDVVNDDVYVADFDLDGGPITAVRLEALPHPSLPGGGPGRGTILGEGDFFLTRFEAFAVPSANPDAMVPVAIGGATQDFAAEGKTAQQALDDKTDTGWSVNAATGQAHAAVFAFAEPVKTEGGGRLRLRIEQNYIHQQVIGRFRISVTSALGPVTSPGVPAHIEALVREDTRTEADETELRDYHALHVAPSTKGLRDRIAAMSKALPAWASTLTLTQREQPQSTRIHHRGEFLEPRAEVQPGVPAVLHPLPAEASHDRLAFARWLVSPENPLVGRVTMNRLWQQYFGQGIVATVDDFGTRGDAPTHPELLDWLAVEFVEGGWDLKAMHRLIVTSATYRQSSRVAPEHLEADPLNRFLERAPRLRLDAEVLRDSALADAGLLNETMGGPSVYPPQPEGVTSLAYGGTEWPTSKGSDRHRRGLYTYWKRTVPYPGAMVFDTPPGDEACVRRRRTNTPLQALAMLNDPVYVEAAQALALRVLDEGGTADEDRVRFLYSICLSREPDDQELERMETFLRRDDTHTVDKATALARSGPAAMRAPTRTDELAKWALLCRAVLNLDETITKE